MICLLVGSGVFKSPTIVMWESMCVLSFSKVSFANVGALAFEHRCLGDWELILVDFSFDEYEVFFPILFINFG